MAWRGKCLGNRHSSVLCGVLVHSSRSNVGFFGTDSFSYTATDGIATSAPATVTITVYSG